MNVLLAYAREMLCVMLPVVPLWALVRGAFLLRSKARPRLWRELLLLLLVLWCAGLASQTVLPSDGYLVPLDSVFSERTLWHMNLVPFRTIAEYFTVLRDGGATAFLLNIAGNILVFVPLGLLPPLLWRRWRGTGGILLPALCSLFIETAQIFTGRHVDIDDLLLNALGGLLGWLCARAVNRLKERHHESA